MTNIPALDALASTETDAGGEGNGTALLAFSMMALGAVRPPAYWPRSVANPPRHALILPFFVWFDNLEVDVMENLTVSRACVHGKFVFFKSFSRESLSKQLHEDLYIIINSIIISNICDRDVAGRNIG